MKKISNLRIMGTLAVSLLAVGALVACGGDASSMSNGDLLKAAMQNDKNIKSYHIDLEITGGDGDGAFKVSADVDAANKKYKMDRTMSTKSAKMSGSDIKIGDKLYSSRDNGQWVESSSSMEATLNDSLINILRALKPEAVDQVKDRLKDGNPAAEKIEGADTRHMTASMQDLAAIGGGDITEGTVGTLDAEGIVDIWVSTSPNSIIRRLKITGKSDGEDRQITITRSKIDEQMAVAIEAPQLAPTSIPAPANVTPTP